MELSSYASKILNQGCDSEYGGMIEQRMMIYMKSTIGGTIWRTCMKRTGSGTNNSSDEHRRKPREVTRSVVEGIAESMLLGREGRGRGESLGSGARGGRAGQG